MKKTFDFGEVMRQFEKINLPVVSYPPACAMSGHHLIPDNDGVFLCRYCAKRFVEQPTTKADDCLNRTGVL